MQNKIFKLKSEYKPDGDQPKAISELVKGLEKGMHKQTLLGATGTGKTFTIANVIAKYNKPTLVIAHNKTLAAQLASEFREFFPESAVHYFVSYYDYYQPEAYMPVTDTYIEKDAQINKEIDRLRHATTQALLTRKDVIIVASVSCIYGLGSPEEYQRVNLKLELGEKLERVALMKKLIEIHFERTNADINPGQFRSIGSKVEVMPISETFIYQIEFAGGKISRIAKVDPVSSHIISEEKSIFFFPAKHFITEKGEFQLTNALENMKAKGTKFIPGQVTEWLDCGNKNATVYTNQRVLEFDKGKTQLKEKNIKNTNSVIIEPCFIGENVELTNSVVGPHVSVSANSKIKYSIIQNSIIQKDSKINNANISNSILGIGAEVTGKALDLSISDYTQIVV